MWAHTRNTRGGIYYYSTPDVRRKSCEKYLIDLHGGRVTRVFVYAL